MIGFRYLDKVVLLINDVYIDIYVRVCINI